MNCGISMDETKMQIPRSINEGDGRSEHGGVYETLQTNSTNKNSSEINNKTTILTSFQQQHQPQSSTIWMKWCQNLHSLLDDSLGVILFKKYLESENSSSTLDFWFACEGLRKNVDKADTSKIHQLIKVIYRTYVRTDHSIPIRSDTRKAISDAIRRKDSFHVNLFNNAQKEVELAMLRRFYPAFLESDIFTSFKMKSTLFEPTLLPQQQPIPILNSPPNGGDIVGVGSGTMPIVTGNNTTNQSWHSLRHSTNSGNNNNNNTSGLETLDEELEVCFRHLTCAEQSLQGCGSNRHIHCTATCASSGGVVDTSSLICPAPLTSENLLQSRSFRAELSLRREDTDNFIDAKTSHSHQRTPMNPYHSAYAPAGSMQESELHSLSSDAHTDDTLSINTESSLDANLIPSNRRQWKYQRRAMRRAAQMNVNIDDLSSSTGGCGIVGSVGGIGSDTLMDTTAHFTIPSHVKPPRNIAEVDPPVFAHLLCEKLNRLLEEKALHQHLSVYMQQMGDEESSSTQGNESVTSQLPSVLHQPWATGLLRAAAQAPSHAHDAQSILEDHCAKVWEKSADQTPPPQPIVSSWTQQTSYAFVSPPSLPHHQLTLPPPPPPTQQQQNNIWQTDSFFYNNLNNEQTVPMSNAYHGNNSSSDKVKAWIYEANEFHSYYRPPAGSGHSRRHRSDHNQLVRSQSSVNTSITGGGGGFEASSSSGISHSGASAGPLILPPAPLTSQPPVQPTTLSQTCLTVGYYLPGDPVPYRVQWQGGPTLTLAQFKQLIAKRGNYRYFFKKCSDEFETGVVQEEIKDDNEVLPLWEGKVMAKLEKLD